MASSVGFKVINTLCTSTNKGMSRTIHETCNYEDDFWRLNSELQESSLDQQLLHLQKNVSVKIIPETP